MYKSKELESIFIEIINKEGKNTIADYIYRHPKLAIDEINNQFLSPMTVCSCYVTYAFQSESTLAPVSSKEFLDIQVTI